MDDKGKLCPIKGQPPSLINLPSGCAFRPRCAYAKPECATKMPALKEITAGHFGACHFCYDEEFLANSASCLVGRG